ncbi:hypothetical protein BH23ACT9_BH23ACT9_34950 [soil metagenome]
MVVIVATPTPRQVARSIQDLGESLSAWRRLLGLTTAEVADRAGVTRKTVESLEGGRGSSVDTLMRVVRVLGLTERVLAAVDPMETDLGRARADQHLPARVRKARP